MARSTTSSAKAGSRQPAASAGSRKQATGSRNIPQLIFGDLWEFDPAPETADPKIKPQYELFIGGKFVEPRSGKYFDSFVVLRPDLAAARPDRPVDPGKPQRAEHAYRFHSSRARRFATRR